MSDEPVVYAVDDDPITLKILRSLIGVAGYQIETYNSGRVFLESYDPDRPACLLLDMNMPEMSGREVQEALTRDGVRLPIIFLTAHGDIPTCAEAFRAGAFDFLQKPANAPHLVDRVREALASKRDGKPHESLLVDEKPLTKRETEVMQLIVAGRSLKQIAAELQVSVQTAAKHRARMLEKLGVANDVALVRLVLEQGNAPSTQTA